MSNKTIAVVTTRSNWGGRRPGAGRPRKSTIAGDKPERRVRRVEVIRETETRGAIVMTTPHGVRIEGLTLEQLLSLLGALA